MELQIDGAGRRIDREWRAEGGGVLVDEQVARHRGAQHEIGPAVVAVEVEVGRVDVARLLERAVDGIDVFLEVEVILEDAVLEEADLCGGEADGLPVVGDSGEGGAGEGGEG